MENTGWIEDYHIKGQCEKNVRGQAARLADQVFMRFRPCRCLSGNRPSLPVLITLTRLSACNVHTEVTKPTHPTHILAFLPRDQYLLAFLPRDQY